MTLSTYNYDSAVALVDGDYYDYVWNKISQANQRIWASVFIVNPSTAGDTDLKVRELLKHLAYAKWRNVDVKILVGQSQVGAIQVQTGTAMKYLHTLGVEARTFQSKENTSLHSKYMVIDDNWVIVGSNNWSPGGLTENNEDALSVSSPDLNMTLAASFEKHWNESYRRETA